MVKSALIFLADGSEEIEFSTTYDVLVRAGVSVTSVYVGQPKTGWESNRPAYATCSRGVKIVPDLYLPDIAGAHKSLAYDAYIVPGGQPGANTLANNTDVAALLEAAYGQGKITAFICAGPLAAKAAGITDKAITSHPSAKAALQDQFTYSEDRVVKSDNLITSRGPGTTFEFALAIAEALVGKEKRQEIAPPLLLPPGLL